MAPGTDLGRVVRDTIRRDADPALLLNWPAEEVLAFADDHGLTGVLAAALSDAAIPLALRESLAAEANRLAVVEALREPELRALLSACDAAGVPVLLFKGAQVAYQCYAHPELRPRIDSDVLVRPGDRDAAAGILATLGYQAVDQFEGPRISHQRTFVKRWNDSVVHVVDLHWRISNPEEFGQQLSWDHVAPNAVGLPALGSCARGLGAADALLTALVHPVAHHQNAGRLVWDLDVTLLVEGMTDADWDALLAWTSHPVISAACAVRLQRARDLFAARVPRAVIDRLMRASRDKDRSRLSTSRQRDRHLVAVIASLRAFPRWTDRAQFMREHLFPSASYMRKVYAPDSRAPLAVLYARRALTGARRWITRPAAAIE